MAARHPGGLHAEVAPEQELRGEESWEELRQEPPRRRGQVGAAPCCHRSRVRVAYSKGARREWGWAEEGGPAGREATGPPQLEPNTHLLQGFS